VTDDELPADPDEDALPPEIAENPGPFFIEGVDEDGNVWSGPVEKIDLARGFADARRVLDADNDPA
jgi:hypothetical protein